ncbi:MAG TPA: hypothetical protein VFU81_08325 [Thermomicrobiales bacterium]|nr:hypothetical protein [Thermomicrobiales bacterium]
MSVGGMRAGDAWFAARKQADERRFALAGFAPLLGIPALSLSSAAPFAAGDIFGLAGEDAPVQPPRVVQAALFMAPGTHNATPTP